MSRKFHRFRRSLGAVLLLIFVGLPFLRVGGESAFRFDVPTLRLLLFGTTVPMADFFIILIAVIFITFAGIVATTLFGRMWCGWLCPQTILVDATDLFDAAGKRRGFRKIAPFAAGILVSMVIAASLIGYFVSPYDLPALLTAGGMAAKIVAGSFLVLFIIIALDLIALRRTFCATVCPYAKLQGVLFDERTLVVAFDPRRAEECMHCNACAAACPVGIDIRKGSQTACIHCAECVDACTDRMARRGRSSLVQYTFGAPGVRGSGVRAVPLITGAVAVAAFAVLIYLSATRMPFDMTMRLDYATPPAIGADGSITNTYELSLRNMSASDLQLVLFASASTGAAAVSPAAITLPKSADMTHTRVAVSLPGISGKEHRPATITLTLRSEQTDKSLSKSIYFAIPNIQ